MQIKCLAAALTMMLVAILPLDTQAKVAGVQVGVAYWDYEPAGNINYLGSDADLVGSLALDNGSDAFFWIAIEHPVPGLPNLKLMNTNLGLQGNGVVTTPFSFNGDNFNTTDDISSSLEFNQIDVILYYELLDTVTHFDLGVNFKVIDAKAAISSIAAGANQNVEFQGVVPLLYANLSFKLPLSGLSIGVEASALGTPDNSVSDILARLGYKKGKLGVELGYRQLKFSFDDLDSLQADVTIKGPFAAIRVEF